MAVSTVTSREIKVQISPDRMFKALVTHAHTVLNKVASSAIKSVHIIEGDADGVGTIRYINFYDGAPFPTIKDELAVVDTENLRCKWVILEGPVLGDTLESIQSVHHFTDSGDGGCIVKIVTEHQAAKGGDISLNWHKQPEDLKSIKEHGIGLFALVEEYLLANPLVCE